MCVNITAEFFYSNWKKKKSKPKRTIERKIASLIFLESHDVEGTLFVESLACLAGRGRERAGRQDSERNGVEGEGGGRESPEREGGKKEKRLEKEKPKLRIFCIPWVAKQKSPRRGKKLRKVDTVKNNG